MKNFLIKILTKADTKGLEDTASEADNVEQQLDQADTEAKNLNTTINKLGKAAGLVALGAVLVATTKKIVNMAKQAAAFNITIARTAFMAKTLDFKELRAGALDVSNKVGTAREEISEGLYAALSKGVPEENLFSFLKQAAEAAKADGSSTVEVVEGVTTVLNAFNIPIKESRNVLTEMFTAVATGGATFGDLSANMSAVAPAAAAMNVPLPQILAAVSALTASGTPASVAMTQIRSAMLALNPVLGEGWSKSYTFQDALRKVKEQAGGSQIKLKKMLGTDEALMGVLGLTSEAANDVADSFEELSKKGDPFKDAVEAVTKHSHWEKAGVLVSNFFNKVGTIADDALKPLIERFNELFDGLNANDGIGAALKKKAQEVVEVVQTIWNVLEAEKGEELAHTVGKIMKGYLMVGAAEVGEAIKAAFEDLPVLGNMIDNEKPTDRLRQFIKDAPPLEPTLKERGASNIEEGTAEMDEITEAAARLREFKELAKTAFDDLATETEAATETQVEESKENAAETLTITNDILAKHAAAGAAATAAMQESLKQGQTDLTKSIKAETEKVEETTEDAVKEMGEVAETLNGATGEMVTQIGGALVTVGDGIKEVGTSTAEGLSKTVAGIDELTTANEAAFLEMSNTMQSILYTVQDVAQLAAQANSKVDSLRNQIA